VVRLRAGHPRNGSPIRGSGIQGNWWGIAIGADDRVSLSNFTGDDPADFTSPSFVGGNATSLFASDGTALSPRTGFTNGALHAPQGIAVDQRGNVWIANHGNATVTEYPLGNPSQARVVAGGGLHNPFAVEADGRGNVWVDNGSLHTSVAGSLTKITPDGQAIGPFPAGGMRSPHGMAFDSAGDLWVASLADSNVTRFAANGTVRAQYRAPSLQGASSVAIDGDGNVWVASFLGQKLTELCARNTAHCTPGMKTGESVSLSRHGWTSAACSTSLRCRLISPATSGSRTTGRRSTQSSAATDWSSSSAQRHLWQPR
jgi:streptogramin lyase